MTVKHLIRTATAASLLSKIHLPRNASLLAVVPVVLFFVCGGPQADALTQSPEATDPSWVVKILYPEGDKNVECTGSVLNERWILTSAHCLHGAGSSYFETRHNSGGGAGRARFYRHPQFDEDETANDVGLVYLQERPLDISRARQAKLFTDSRRPWRDDSEPDEFAMSAWGLGSDPGGTSNCDNGRAWTHRQATFEVDYDSDSAYATASSDVYTHGCHRDSGAPWMLRRGSTASGREFMLFAVYKGQSTNYNLFTPPYVTTFTEHAALLETNLVWVLSTLASVGQSTPYHHDCRALSWGGWRYQQCNLSSRGWAELIGLGNMCMTAMGTTSGSPVQLRTCSKSSWSQGWSLLPSGMIRSQVNPLLCLNRSPYPYGLMQVTTCTTSGVNARFNLTTEPYLRLETNWDSCVDAPPAFTTSGSPSYEGTPLQILGCNGNPSQRWTMRLPTEVFAR